ncbi:MAG: hypothetical protein Q9165_007693 [Trypethelium subeluteriae]
MLKKKHLLVQESCDEAELRKRETQCEFPEVRIPRHLKEMPACLSRDSYTFGWVCALPIELAAAQAMLDEQHDDLPQDDDDDNAYSFGNIGDHNVVLACLTAGQAGTNSAAAVAMQMKSSFRAIRFGLMVGIGGGVPNTEADIRLGDIVISQPSKGQGGVIQYDFGKSTPNGIERIGFLNTPPRILLTAISKLRANHDLGKNHISNHISTLSRLSKFSRKQAGDDTLFEAVYNHVRGDDCTSCDNTKELRRRTRSVDAPEIHYGTIASGNLVIRDGVTRDQISTEFGEVLCFEMEAAGLMNSFPCLVIRGICDYADSHKNKRWQPYAAGTAAAYAKELLMVVPEREVRKTRLIERQISSGCDTVSTDLAHITTVRPLARSIHRSLFTSSDQFRPFQDDLARLVTILETIIEDSTDHQIDCEKEPALCKLAQDLHQILNELLKLKEHYDSVGSRTQRTWEQQQWRADELSEIRSRLTSTTSALNTVYIKLIHSSTKMVLLKLDTFIDEVRSGKREDSVVTHHTTGSLSADGKEAWRQLRKELESIGITPALFNEHHDIIIARLQQAIENGDLVEIPSEGPSDDTAGYNNDQAPDFGNHFPNAEGSGDEYLASLDDMGRTISQSRTLRTNIQPPNATPTLPVRGPGRIERLLSRITSGESRLRKAVEQGNETLVRELLQKGVDVNPSNLSGDLPLLTKAAGLGHEAVARLLLETGRVDVNSKDGSDMGTALTWALVGGNEAIVRLLIEKGKVDVHLPNQMHGTTPLSLAAIGGHEAVVRLLLETGKVDVDVKDPRGTTPLSYSASRGNEAVVRLLIETGKVDVDSKDQYGRTPLWRAACGAHRNIVWLLHTAGETDVNSKVQQTDNWAPLSWAVRDGHEVVMGLLSQSPPKLPPSVEYSLHTLQIHSNIVLISSPSTKDAIVDALYRCVIGLDANDRPLFESAWVKSEAIFDMDGDVMDGMDAINTKIFDHIGPLDTQHMISNIRVDHKDGADQAYVTAYSLAQHYRAGEGKDPETKRLLSGSSYYVDVIKDGSDGLWKIKRWTMKFIWVEGDMSIVRPS